MNTGDQLPLAFETRASQGRADFIVTPATVAAVSLIDSWPDWPAPAVAVFGPTGSGKSHLAAIWQETSGAVQIGIDELEATASLLQTESEVQNKCYVLKIPGRGLEGRQQEESLFHLLNTVREKQAFLLLIGRQPPARLDVGLPDLKSRLRALPAVEIPAPDDDLLRGLLTKMFNDRQLSVSTDVVEYMVPRMERSFEGARLLVERLDNKALSQKRAITIPFVRDMLDT